MILHFVKISGLLRFSKTYYGQCPSKNAKIYLFVFFLFLFVGGFQKHIKQIGSGGPNLRNARSSRKVRYEKKIRMIPSFSCIV